MCKCSCFNTETVPRNDMTPEGTDDESEQDINEDFQHLIEEESEDEIFNEENAEYYSESELPDI